MKRPKRENYTNQQHGKFIYDLNNHIDYLEHQNKELVEALMETDLYYRNEVAIPNKRICKINFDLLKTKSE